MEQGLLKLLPAVFLGGGIGASLRWLISGFVASGIQKAWAGTFVVNILGCIIYYLITKNSLFSSKEASLFIKTGILGSLTTFSTFSFEVVTLLKSGRIAEGIAVCLLNIITGIVIGIWILR